MAKQIRARLNEKEYELIQQYRGMVEEAQRAGIPAQSVNHGWFKGKHWSLHFKGMDSGIDKIRREIIEKVSNYAPKYQALRLRENKGSSLLVIDPADVHIGKLCSEFETGDKYNADIATERVMDGVNGILSRSSGWKKDQILIVIGNDILHVDTPKSTTTSGIFQDSHLMWYDAFTIAYQIYIKVIEMVLPTASIRVQYNPSNHDYTNGFFLAQLLQAWFRNAKNVVFDASPAHRKYFRYYNNLIGSTHGDGAKTSDLALLMAHEDPEGWAACQFRYMYTHHVHHKFSKDFMSVTVEALRSPSGTDSWHHRNGYQHSPKAVEGFIHDKQMGQVARLTHYF